MKNNKCVYLHKDKEGVVRYVGSGTIRRANLTGAESARGKAYADFVNVNGKLKVEIISEGLTKIEAENFERELYDDHLGTILNARRPNSEMVMTKEMFEDYFYYDETSKSCLRWKVDVSFRAKANSEAGCLNKSSGYWQVQLKNHSYQIHRIIALLYDYVIESRVIDHIDRSKTNNKIENLRVVTQQENCNNLSLYCNNTSGVQGVSFQKRDNAWIVFWREDQKQKSKYFTISTYGSSEDAFHAAVTYRNYKNSNSFE